MIQAMHTAAVGMKSQQQSLDTVANNIANIETTGFKKERVNFKDALYVAMQDASDANSTENLQKGTGALVGSVSKIFAPAPITQTGSMLDVALESSDTFFTVETIGGDIKYTRDGNFKLSVEGDGTYVVNHSGEYIIDNNGDRIAIPDDANENSISIDIFGNMSGADGEEFATLGIVSFQNTAGLSKVGGNCFVETVNSGEAIEVDDAGVRQGYLEASNVDLADEVTTMIKAQRAYQLSSRILSIADQMEEMANRLRK